MRRFIVFLLLAAFALLLVIVIRARGGGFTYDVADEGVRAAYLGIIGAAVGASLLTMFRGRFGQALESALLWVALGAVLFLGHSYRNELLPIGQRLLGELIPGTAIETGPPGTREITITRRGAGLFRVEVRIDGRPVRMLVDTGASSVVLSAETAERIGIDTKTLNFRVPIVTANGVTEAATYIIPELSIGPIVETRIPALITRPGRLTESLLGHTFLDRLASYEVSGNRMILRGRN